MRITLFRALPRLQLLPARSGQARVSLLLKNLVGKGSSMVSRSHKRGGFRGRAMVTDILVAALWGATIPGLMWLGAAGGF